MILNLKQKKKRNRLTSNKEAHRLVNQAKQCTTYIDVMHALALESFCFFSIPFCSSMTLRPEVVLQMNQIHSFYAFVFYFFVITLFTFNIDSINYWLDPQQIAFSIDVIFSMVVGARIQTVNKTTSFRKTAEKKETNKRFVIQLVFNTTFLH